MEEIKEYLKARKTEASNKVIAYSLSGIFSGLMTKEKRKELMEKSETVEKEYQRLKKMLEQLDQLEKEKPKAGIKETEDIKEAYNYLLRLLLDEHERVESTIDVSKNEMKARLRADEIDHARAQLKHSLWTYESEKYT